MTHQSASGRERSAESPKSVIAAFLANAAIAAAKFVAFLFTGSSAMLSESIHSVADTGNQALLLVGRHRSQRPATEQYPFGFGQEAYFWTLLVAVVLFVVGSMFSLFEGYRKLLAPEDLHSPLWAYGVLLVAAAAEGLSLRTARREAMKDRSTRPALGRSWWSYATRTRRTDNLVVLLEDSAAEIGLGAVAAGITLSLVTGEPRFDAAGSLVIGLVLAGVAVALAAKMRGLLVGASAPPSTVAVISAVLQRDPRVVGVAELRTMQLGPRDILVAARVRLDGDVTIAEGADALDAAAAAVGREVAEARHVYLEPEAVPGN